MPVSSKPLFSLLEVAAGKETQRWMILTRNGHDTRGLWKEREQRGHARGLLAKLSPVDRRITYNISVMRPNNLVSMSATV